MNSSAALPTTLLQWIDRSLALFYPNVCQICREHKATRAEGYVCTACRDANDGVKFIEPPFCNCCGLPFHGEISVSFECSNCRDDLLHFRSARAAVQLTGLVQDVIHRYKYNQAGFFEPFLAGLFVRQAQPVLASHKWDFIVPIPLHWLKFRERAFNQSTRLARHLSRATGIPVNEKLLRRKKPTSTQTRLTRAQRAQNVKGAFAYRGKKQLQNNRIVLVDDVLTTGATASACAKVLIDNGASVVDVWTVARGILK